MRLIIYKIYLKGKKKNVIWANDGNETGTCHAKDRVKRECDLISSKSRHKQNYT